MQERVDDGIFDKKYCDICGEKIGLLGNRKLEDGNLCPLDNTRYRNYKETCEEICSLLGYMRCNAVAGQRTEAPVPDGDGCINGATMPDERVMSDANQTAYAAPTRENVVQSWSCPYCGATNQGKFCENCGASRPDF